jgi:hypothetical protein
MLTLTGCASVERVDSNGTKTSYHRFGNQEIGKLVITSPTTGVLLELEGQRAMNDKFVKELSEGIAGAVIDFWRGGM